MNVADARDCVYFNPSVDRQTGFKTRAVLCVPIFDSDRNVVAVLQAVNKLRPAQQRARFLLGEVDDGFDGGDDADAEDDLVAGSPPRRRAAPRREASASGSRQRGTLISGLYIK